MSAPTVADALSFHHNTTNRLAATWSRYALLVVTPPHGKDLDNLVRDDILPTVHDILAPQPAPWLTRFPQLTYNEQVTWRPKHRRLQQLRQNSVTAYEIIQLARNTADPDAGALRLALGSATAPGSTWTRIADFVERHIERLQP